MISMWLTMWFGFNRIENKKAYSIQQETIPLTHLRLRLWLDCENETAGKLVNETENVVVDHGNPVVVVHHGRHGLVVPAHLDRNFYQTFWL